MTTTALCTMVFTIVVVCGGFMASIVRLQIISQKQAKEDK